MEETPDSVSSPNKNLKDLLHRNTFLIHPRKPRRNISSDLGDYPRLTDVSLPNLLRVRGALGQKEFGLRPKRQGVHDFIQGKRDILLAKMRVNEKQQNLKDLREKMAYEETQLQMKMNYLHEDTAILSKSIEEQKKLIDLLSENISSSDEIIGQKNRQLIDTKNKTYQKEAELRNIKHKLNEFGNCREYVVSVYEHFGKAFEERVFLEYFEFTRKAMRESFNARQAWSSITARIREEMLEFSPNPLFLTAAQTISKRQATPARVSGNIQLLKDFYGMLNIIEKDHFDLFSELQVQEANVIELEHPSEELSNQTQQANPSQRKTHQAPPTAAR
jgi:hypothetical protein